ncbi:MAG TPA: glycosyltransferase family 39 protein [Chloroflexota bacterium]|nr:glycosyltransferase family 39 protein [Chloroflexota bacterium]
MATVRAAGVRLTLLDRLQISKRASLLGVCILPLVALLARLAYAATLSPEIVVTFEADPLTYDQIARNLVAGRGFSGASFYYPPGSDVPTAFWDALYPIFLAAVYTLAGHSVPAVRAVQAVLGAAAVALTYVVGARLADRAVGVLAAAISAVYPFFIYYSGHLLTETLFMTLILAVFAAALCLQDRGTRRWALALGMLSGLAALCRAEALPFGLALMVWTAWRSGGTTSRRLGLAATAVVALLVVTAPWVIRNQRTFHAPILTTTKLGYNLYKYYHPQMTADQTVRAVPFPDLDGLTEPQREAVMRGQGLRFMAQDPGRTAWFMANKLALLFKLTPSNEVNRQYALVSLVSYGALLPFMALGFILALRGGWSFAPLLAYVLFSIANKAAVFAGIRLRMQVEPFLIILAALALTRVAGRLLRAPAPAR